MTNVLICGKIDERACREGTPKKEPKKTTLKLCSTHKCKKGLYAFISSHTYIDWKKSD
jgi:hypothetical protein